MTPLEEAIDIHRRVMDTYFGVYQEYCSLTGSAPLGPRAAPPFYGSVKEVIKDVKSLIVRIDETRAKIEVIRNSGVVELNELKQLANGYY